MMQREKLLGILNQLDTESLLKALQVNGIKIDNPMQDVADFELDDGNAPEKWGDIILEAQADNRPKKLLDKKFLQVKQQPAAPVDSMPYLGAESDSSMEDWSTYGLGGS